jgi:hypothetical protein
VSIGPNGDGASPSPPASEVGLRNDPNSGDDPVFLLARPQDKARITAVPPEPRPLPTVAKPPVSITHPAPIIGNRPRLPSVIVDPESADPEASDRLTRAAAVTRAPSQARNGPARRPQVPLLADAPRTLGPPAGERRAGKPSRRDNRPASSRSRESQSRESQSREAPVRAPQPSLPERTERGPIEAAEATSSRPALHPTSVELSEPPPAEALRAPSPSSEALAADVSGGESPSSDAGEPAAGRASNPSATKGLRTLMRYAARGMS